MKSNLTNRSKVTVSMLTIFSMALSLVGAVPQAKAALTAVGPIIDPVNNGFPQWYSDENGLALQLCLDQTPSLTGAGLCVLTPEFDPDPTVTPGVAAIPIGTVASGAFPDESFYWIADAILLPGVRLPGANTNIKITYRAALEQAFLAGLVPGTQNIFLRVQADINGLVPGETYTVTHPYGTMTVVADATGGGRTRFEDMGACVQGPTGLICSFANPLATNPVLQAPTTNVGAFLQWDPAVLPAAPAGFIGDPNIEHQVIGGRGGVNSLTVSGLNVGGAGVNSISTNMFAVAGKLADTIPPVITLTGGTPFNVTAGTAYVEPGATAFDAFDAATTTAVVSTSTVPAGKLTIGTGPFSVTYTASDNAGNVATLTRSVVVVPDTIAPVVALNGSSTVNLKVGTPYVELGATVADNVDGPMANATATGTVNVNLAGTYIVTYTSAADSSGLVGTNTRTVNVADDVTAPVITILGANPASVSQGDVYTDAGATASDDFDGNRTANIVTTGLPINTTATGTFSVVYTVADLTGNIRTATRTVNVIRDATAPVITLNGTNPVSVLVGAVYTDAGATAVDNIDGNVTANIVPTGLPINTTATGTFTVTYTVTDAAGNVGTATRTVNVVTDAVAPVISITGANPANVTVGSAYADSGATALDAVDGTVAVTSTSTVNTAVAGSYTVTYTATDAAGNVATATRTVVVSVPPVVSGGGGGGGGGVFIPSAPTEVSAINVPLVVTKDQAGKLSRSLADGSKAEVRVPNGAVTAPTTFDVTQSTLAAANAPAGAVMIGDKAYVVTAKNASGATVSDFGALLQISIAPASLPADVSNVSVFVLNESTRQWSRVQGVIFDPTKGEFKFHINHLSTFALFRTTSSTVGTNVPPKEVLGVKIFDDGILIRGKNKKIFVITNGQKRHIVNLVELRKHAGKPIREVDDATLAKISDFTGKVLGIKLFEEGTLIRTKDGKIFVMEKGIRKPVSSLAELQRKHRGKKINNVSDDELKSIPLVRK